MGPGVRQDDLGNALCIPLRPLGSITSVSGILDRPPEPVIRPRLARTRWRAMTAACDASSRFSVHPISKQHFAFSRLVLPELCFTLPPLPRKEGAGKTGCRLAPMARCANAEADAHSGKTTGGPETTGLPCAMVGTAYVAISPVRRALLPPSPCGLLMQRDRSVRCTTTRLDASFGRQDHAIWPYAKGAGRSRDALAHGLIRPATAFAPTPPASTASRPAYRDDRETPLSVGLGDLRIR